MIHPQVHRTLSQGAIRDFIKKKKINIELISEETGIDLGSELGINYLLDHLFDTNEITKSEINDFLIDQLNYGRMKNVYIKFLKNVQLLINENDLKESLENLNHFYEIIIPNIKSSKYTGNLLSSIQPGIRKLIYYDIIKDSSGIPQIITLLLGSCITNKKGDLCNNYASIELDLKEKTMQIRLKNWENDTIDKTYGVDKDYYFYNQLIEKCFKISTEVKKSKTQKMIYKMNEDLISVVLGPTEKKVNKKLEQKIKLQIKELSSDLFGPTFSLPPRESDVIKELILNNFYKLSLLKELNGEKITDKYLINKGIEGYPRYLKFFDDTVGEGKAKSQTSKESILTTDVFYDNRARLKQSNNICFSTIYWLSLPNMKKSYGTSFYLDKTNTADRKYYFKYIVKNHFFTKEESDYVLRKIIKYY